jgi:hypothetical protein
MVNWETSRTSPISNRQVRLITVQFVVAYLLFGLVSMPEEIQRIKMPTYTVSIPNNWYFEREENECIFACNDSKGKCTASGGGYPLSGKVSITVLPNENLFASLRFNDLDEMMAFHHRINKKLKTGIDEVKLHRQQGAPASRCLVIRYLIFDDIWHEFYGIEIDGRLFEAVVEYNDEPKNNDKFRKIIVEILSSIASQKAH